MRNSRSRPVIEGAGHKLILKLPPQQIVLEADSVRLAQVFSNLLNNAAKYTEHGGTIWLTAEQQPGSKVRISVCDTGIGIPTELLPRIFDIFMQVDQPMLPGQRGLGIGLTLVKRLVEMHHGTVEAHSDGPGKGSVFTVTLPEAGFAKDSAKATMSDVVSSGRHRILIADDNADIAESLAIMLRLMGHEVRTVSDGLQAIEQAMAFVPEMILLDIGMPGVDGYEAARRIRSQHWDKPLMLVALTGWGQEEDRRRSVVAGFDYHFTKPVNPADLERLVAQLPPAVPPGGDAQLSIDL
jgi:CheY-like chemotaxis protein